MSWGSLEMKQTDLRQCGNKQLENKSNQWNTMITKSTTQE
jgi:hypothetical protein